MSDWDIKLINTLWAYCTTYKVMTKFTPFQLVYGQKAILPIELELLSLRNAINEHLGEAESLEAIINVLEKFNEIQGQAYLNSVAIQKWHKSYYDNKMKDKKIGPMDFALLYDDRIWKFPRKFRLYWLGPYKVRIIHANECVQYINQGKRVVVFTKGRG